MADVIDAAYTVDTRALVLATAPAAPEIVLRVGCTVDSCDNVERVAGSGRCYKHDPAYRVRIEDAKDDLREYALVQGIQNQKVAAEVGALKGDDRANRTILAMAGIVPDPEVKAATVQGLTVIVGVNLPGLPQK